MGLTPNVETGSVVSNLGYTEGSPGMLLQSADSQAPTPETLVESGLMVGFRNLHF